MNSQPARRDLRIDAADGMRLTASVFEPEGSDGAPWAVIHSATAVRRGFYEPFANYLATRGFRVLTYDYRGVGQSRPVALRGFQARLRDWGEKDMPGAIAYAGANAHGARIVCAGHSSGGELFGLAPNNEDVSAFLAVAPANGHPQHWTGVNRLLLAGLYHVAIPGLALAFGYLPGKRIGLGMDLPKGVALEWARFGRHRDYIVDGDGRPIRDGYMRYGGPMVFYSVEDDGYGPKAAVDAIAAFYENARVTRRHVTPADAGVDRLGHFGFFRKNVRDTLWREAADWLLQYAG